MWAYQVMVLQKIKVKKGSLKIEPTKEEGQGSA